MLGPYRVPQNVMVYILFYQLHNSPKLWHMPEVFLPERWSGQGEGAADLPVAGAPADREDEEGLARNGKKYLPFSEGPRGCLGQVSCLYQDSKSISAQPPSSKRLTSIPPLRRGWP